MISALEHYSYCPRQCALIHVEQTFDENLFTLRGRREHKRVDEPMREQRRGVKVERALPLWSARLGLVGRADVVEYEEGIPYPVEYKYGRKRLHDHAEIQLCAQALCLEEMSGNPVPKGALFFTASHRREEVAFTSELRLSVEQMIEAVRLMLRKEQVPPPVYDARCRHCSLKPACLPASIDNIPRQKYWSRQLFEVSDSL